MLTKWNHKIGCELTFMPQMKHLTSERDVDDLACLMADHVEKSIKANKIKVFRVQHDPQCVEIPTVVHTKWSTFKRDYFKISNLLKTEFNFGPSLEGFTGGGGHIHIEVPFNVQVAIQRDFAMRPYIAWAFNHYSDNLNAKNFYRDVNKVSVANKGKMSKFKNFPTHNNVYVYTKAPILFFLNYEVISDSKRFNHNSYYRHSDYLYSGNYAVSYNSSYKTMEFRFFNSAENWEMQEEHLAFVLSYVNWIKKRIANKDEFLVDYLKDIKLPWCKTEFKKLITTLELPWDRYKKYTEVIEERFLQQNLD